jgi:hypothetical protein
LDGLDKYSDVSLDVLLKANAFLKYGALANKKKWILDFVQKVTNCAQQIYEELQESNASKPKHLTLNDGEFHQLRAIISGHISEAVGAIKQ